MSFLSVLQIVFITLKLCGVVAWSWWCVMTPVLLGVTLMCMAFLATVLFAMLCED